MKHFVLAACMLFSPPAAHAETSHMLQGLFCNSEARLDQLLALVPEGIAPRLVLPLQAGDELACVYADRIAYLVIDPVEIGQFRARGILLTKYRASLVAVDVGGSIRPVEPPVQIYFARRARLPGAAVQGGA